MSSKASEWAEASMNPPSFSMHDLLGSVGTRLEHVKLTGLVTRSADLGISYGDLSVVVPAPAARAFARWILDTFGDQP